MVRDAAQPQGDGLKAVLAAFLDHGWGGTISADDLHRLLSRLDTSVSWSRAHVEKLLAGTITQEPDGRVDLQAFISSLDVGARHAVRPEVAGATPATDPHSWTAAAWADNLKVGGWIAKALLQHTLPGEGEVEAMRRVARGTRADVLSLLRKGDFLGTLADHIWRELQVLNQQVSWTASELRGKFAQEAGFELAFADLPVFYEGLDGMVGVPGARPLDEMTREHLSRPDSHEKFFVPNYGIETTSAIEFLFVTKPEEGPPFGLEEWPSETKNCPPEQRRRVRLAEWREEARANINRQLRALREPELLYEEFVAAELYTGPMFQKYNTVNRGGALNCKQPPFMTQQYERLCMGNRYTTTIHLLNSAIIKMSKLVKAQTVYRGISSGLLPREFFEPNELGVCGGIECGFTSTTVDKHVALTYAKFGKTPTLLEINMGMIDRGADLSVVSQYPHEREICFPPLTAIQVLGMKVDGQVLVVQGRFNINLRGLTIEQVIGKRKQVVVSVAEHVRDEVNAVAQGEAFAGARERAHATLEAVLQPGPEHFNGDAELLQAVATTLDANRVVQKVVKLRRLEAEKGPADFISLAVRSELGQLLHKLGWLEMAESTMRACVAMYRQQSQGEPRLLFRAISDLGGLLSHPGSFEEAEALLREAVENQEAVLGSHHPDTMRSRRKLGQCLSAAGRYEQAEDCLRHSLQIAEAVCGPSHPDTIQAMSELGQLLEKRGSYGPAADLLQQVVKALDAAMGPTHAETLAAMDLLAGVLRQAGKLKEAEALCLKALHVREEVLAPTHLDTLTSLDSVAALWERMGKLQEAQEARQRAFDGRVAVQGPTHPDTLTSMHMLGNVLLRRGRYSEAAALCEPCLRDRAAILGGTHPDTFSTMHTLASVYRGLHRFAEAETMYRRALAGRTAALGPGHPDTLSAVSNFANYLASMGKYLEAAAMQRQVLEDRKLVLGSAHLSTASAMRNVGVALIGLEQWEEAAQLMREALDNHLASLGSAHDWVHDNKELLAKALRGAGRTAEAEAMYRSALEARKAAGGPLHVLTVKVARELAGLLEEVGRLPEAEALHEGVLEGLREASGPEDLQALQASAVLADFLRRAGRLGEAEARCSVALAHSARMAQSDHPEALQGLSSVAFVLTATGRLEEAGQLFRTVVARCDDALGPMHQQTLQAVGDLGANAEARGRLGEAELLFSRAFEGHAEIMGANHSKTRGWHDRLVRVREALARR